MNIEVAYDIRGLWTQFPILWSFKCTPLPVLLLANITNGCVCCAELSAINLIARDSTVGAVKLAVEYKVNIKVCAEKIMAIPILQYPHSPMYLPAEEFTIFLCSVLHLQGYVCNR